MSARETSWAPRPRSRTSSDDEARREPGSTGCHRIVTALPWDAWRNVGGAPDVLSPELMTPKRAIRLAAVALIACLIAGTASMAGVGSERRTTFDARAASLQRTWTHDLAVGVPAASITPLRSSLRRQRPQDEWWAPVWLTTDGRSEEHTSELQSLRHLVCRLLL